MDHLRAPDLDATGLREAELGEFRARTRVHLERVVLPNAERWEAQGRIDAEGWRGLAEAGLLALGHDGEEFLRSAVFLEELGRTGYAGVRAAVGVHAFMATSYLRLFGTPEQQGTYLPAAGRGERIAALAITEAGAGSDLRHLRTRAEPAADGGYRVTGEKLFVANGSRADFFVTLVRTGGGADGAGATGGRGRGLTGASLLVVEADRPGVSRRPQPMLGWRSADVCRIGFDRVPVAAAGLIGRQDRALMYLARALDFERLVAGLLAVGGTAYCLELLGGFVRGHRIKDAPMSANQAVRHRVAELEADFELVRAYAYHAARLHSRGRLDTRIASVLKLKATELAVAAARVCVQYQGARGYLDDSAAARLYRDAMAGTIAAGASELMRELIFDAA